MKTFHPLIRTTHTALLVLAGLSITACAGMTQQEKTPPLVLVWGP